MYKRQGYKYPDKNRKGGIWRKMGGSAYNTGQKVNLPAGTYRFGVQSFMRYGNGNMENTYITHKGSWTMCENGQDGKYSPLYYHNNSLEDESWNAYVYITNGWDTDEDGNKVKPVSAEYALDPDYGNPNGVYNQTAIKCIYDEKWDVYPDNNPSVEAHADWGVGNEDAYGWDDSGWEYQAARFFVAHPEAYRNYVTITLSEPSDVWVGIKKDVNAPYGYWNPWVDYTLEQLADEGGVEGVAADLEENAPVEYYNLQGMRVANPSNGLFIVKQGKKATKQVF